MKDKCRWMSLKFPHWLLLLLFLNMCAFLHIGIALWRLGGSRAQIHSLEKFINRCWFYSPFFHEDYLFVFVYFNFCDFRNRLVITLSFIFNFCSLLQEKFQYKCPIKYNLSRRVRSKRLHVICLVMWIWNSGLLVIDNECVCACARVCVWF